MSGYSMDKIVALCKNRGFVFAGSELYGGLANAWDYGHLGEEMKNNVKKKKNTKVWVASGHVVIFNDPLMDCKSCKARFRADKLIEE